MNILTKQARKSDFLANYQGFSYFPYRVLVLDEHDSLLVGKGAAHSIQKEKSRMLEYLTTYFKAAFSVQERAIVIMFLLVYIWPWLFPQYTVEAAELPFLQQSTAGLPVTEIRDPDEIRWVTVTAYSSTPDQTDDSPFHTATGEHVYWGGVAANSLSIDSRVRFVGYHDDKIFRVNDRMHRRFSDRIDIWFPTRQEAQAWGKRKVQVEIWHQ